MPVPIVVLAAAGLIAVVAVASRSTPTTGGATPASLSAVGWVVEVGGYLAIFAAIIVFALVMRLIGPGEGRRGRRASAPWWSRLVAPLVASVMIGATIAVVARLPIGDLVFGGLADGAIEAGQNGSDASLLEAAESVSAMLVALGIVIVLLVAIIVVGTWLNIRDRPAGSGTGNPLSAVLAGAVDVTLEALAREPDPRRAVIAAYAAMERALAGAGVGRVRSEAPLEYLRRVLAEASVAPDDVRTITDLFQLAKFSRHPVDEPMRRRAIAALQQVRTSTSEA